ncbi:DmsE family decaheme c-type cytochrome [Thiohalomonas denitrificans]|uniref:DmsE family decaheme c-type cytochrome n=1 Tax=Thiohalomonas denitrificans TaxID=415747 RepID=UPI0026EE845D|nr:DmsE family decaheme c-type cytochrome [Thiohalomonas denitrificans]
MRQRRAYAIAALLFLISIGFTVSAQESEETSPTYTDRGADRCLKCHDEFSEFPVMDIFKTKHAESSDPRTPFAKLQCETCHGPGSEHADMAIDDDEEERPPIRDFGHRGAETPVAEQNAVCLSCHDDRHRNDWRGSAHQTGQVACADCHRIHTTHDPVLTPSEEPQVCFQCHTRERSESYRASSHPLRYGLMSCGSCHEPHGSLTESMLRRSTLNQTCYECHAEKRGPFLWEHAPVSEDCTHCHQPHGSNHPALLTQRAPLLCQRCHSQAGHPSIAFTGDLLSGASPTAGLLLGQSCMNCHSQVHGSNHPSGVNLKR